MIASGGVAAPPGLATPPASGSSPEALHRTLGLTDLELTAIVERLGRQPNELELAMFSVMWSEHCSYKSSRTLLRTLPTAGRDVVAGVGENAGVVRIGGGLAVCFKLESHNHPSAVEPYQGAATGVGGILRDIFTMGARPIALLDALKFGSPASRRTRALVHGVIAGVAGYGNCVGVPTVGGELTFHSSYEHNPLVNVMAVGLLQERHLTRAAATGPGNLLVLFGSATGRDGIGGASVLASASFGDSRSERRPTVQIGDPFCGKLLIEASLELVERGLLVGLADLGAAGLTCAASESADRAGTGVIIDLDAVPRREEDMAPFEVMISESQERMLAIVQPAGVTEVLEVCARWNLPAAVVGRVTDDGFVSVVSRGEELARIPARALTGEAIIHDRLDQPPARSRAAPAPGVPPPALDGLPERGMDPGAVLLALLADPNLADRAWVTSRYDQTVGSNTIAGADHGAAVLRIKGTAMGLVMATDSSPRLALLDPYLGAAAAVAECARNVAVTGAQPLGVTNCLNYGDPERPEVFWQLSQAVRGLGDACRALGLTVTGGNVSLYNETSGGAIAPTAQVGIVGLLADVDRYVGPAFREGGDVVGLLGLTMPGLGGSIYADHAGRAPDDQPPSLDLAAERTLLELLVRAAQDLLLRSAQDVASGGTAVALAECCMWGDRGAEITLSVGAPPAVELFGEASGRVVVSTDSEDWPRLETLAAEMGVPARRLGSVGGERLRIRLVGQGATGAAEERGAGVADDLDQPIATLRHAWRSGLPRALGEEH